MPTIPAVRTDIPIIMSGRRDAARSERTPTSGAVAWKRQVAKRSKPLFNAASCGAYQPISVGMAIEDMVVTKESSIRYMSAVDILQRVGGGGGMAVLTLMRRVNDIVVGVKIVCQVCIPGLHHRHHINPEEII